jgi:hypothetical protein
MQTAKTLIIVVVVLISMVHLAASGYWAHLTFYLLIVGGVGGVMIKLHRMANDLKHGIEAIKGVIQIAHESYGRSEQRNDAFIRELSSLKAFILHQAEDNNIPKSGWKS